MSVGAQVTPHGHDVRELLDRLRHGGGADAEVRAVDAAAVVDGAWEALAEAVTTGDMSGELLVNALRQLREVDQQLLAVQQREQVGTRLLGSTLTRMEEADCTVAELVGLAPQLICDLGFSRAIISHIEDGLWIPQTVFVSNDPAWAEEIARAGREQPQQLVAGLLETEMVRRRQALLVTGVQSDPRVHRPIADASMSRSYVASPLLSQGRVVGFLHADRFGQAREVDEADRDLLVAFSEGLRLALSRAALAERLEATQQGLQALTGSLSGVDPRVIDVRRAPAGVDRGALVRIGSIPAPAGTAQLLDRLTRRETEVLRLMVEGRSNTAIANHLVVADSTVKVHVKHILRKMGAATRAEAISMWFTSGAA